MHVNQLPVPQLGWHGTYARADTLHRNLPYHPSRNNGSPEYICALPDVLHRLADPSAKLLPLFEGKKTS